jgi:hypothetical protein
MADASHAPLVNIMETTGRPVWLVLMEKYGAQMAETKKTALCLPTMALASFIIRRLVVDAACATEACSMKEATGHTATFALQEKFAAKMAGRKIGAGKQIYFAWYISWQLKVDAKTVPKARVMLAKTGPHVKFVRMASYVAEMVGKNKTVSQHTWNAKVMSFRRMANAVNAAEASGGRPRLASRVPPGTYAAN